MSAHIHAELMKQYAEDAAETDKPWERWQSLRHDGIWVDCAGQLDWDECDKYRRKPKVIVINGFEVPEPMRKAPEKGKQYWVADLSAEALATDFYWSSDEFDGAGLRRGLCHATKEAAEAHANALLSFTRSDK